ncbi:MAG: efflux transporter outer membrane subunit [Zoogloeaceae bacterium]|jgi:multidrug efflux system outer membrane protein|nr:efflux transporter outer membrane subunit [Zoogloeaceae bacterium]
MIEHPKTRLALALSVSVFLSGCAVGPDFTRPDVPLPEQYETTGTTATSEAAPLNPEWWTLFGDAELNRLVALALENNQDLQAAIARMEAAAAAAREAGADYVPSIDLEGSSLRNHSSARTASGKQTGAMTISDHRAALGVSYELDLWGRIRRLNEAARAEALAGRYARDTVRLSLTSQIAAEYLTLRVVDAELETTAETLSSRQKSLNIVRSRQDAGVSSALDMAQARGALAAAQAQWNQLRRQRAMSENMLGLLTGQPDLKLDAVGNFNAIPLPPLPPAGLPSSLLEVRPDVRLAEEQLIAANARIGVAKAAYFPTIGLTGLLGNESADIADLFNKGTHIWSAGGALFLPIFNAGRTGARVDQATAGQKEALANYLKIVQNAFREVKDALVALREYKEEDVALAIQTDAAREAQDISQARYEAGYVGFLDVLDSQRTLNNAQLVQQLGRRNHLVAAVDLFKALGGGWRPDWQASNEASAETRSGE